MTSRNCFHDIIAQTVEHPMQKSTCIGVTKYEVDQMSRMREKECSSLQICDALVCKYVCKLAICVQVCKYLCSVCNLCNLRSAKIAVHIMQFVHAGV